LISVVSSSSREQGLSCGAIYAVARIAKRISIEKVLGSTQEWKLPLRQVIAKTYPENFLLGGAETRVTAFGSTGTG